jgi:hypothetical protein
LLVEVAFVSLTLPDVGPTTSRVAVTRIPSKRLRLPLSAIVRTIGFGSGFPVEITWTAGVEISVIGALAGSDGGTNS